MINFFSNFVSSAHLNRNQEIKLKDDGWNLKTWGQSDSFPQRKCFGYQGVFGEELN